MRSTVLIARAALATAEDLGGRDQCWGSMLYACRGRSRGDEYDLDPCGHSERYYLGLGIEGPPSVRGQVDKATTNAVDFEDEKAVTSFLEVLGVMTLPCPFSAGRCRNCWGGSMTHVEWNSDEDFGVPRVVPSGARYFRVPDVAAALAQVEGGSSVFPQAELVVAP